MNALTKWFDNLDAGWKLVLAIIGIFSLGLTAGATTTGMLHIPARVSTLEQRANDLNEQINALSNDVKSIRHSETLQLCLSIAEKKKTDWRACIEQ